ncbi:hypothetical protein LSTR_LSTR015887 [Laodelphax striatellus]|uniref:Uncharacterized protein n=1 Tax=Laodelphax striatellus TaxID=195883 RepID=A0A482XV27_LAOST|nr:hypothetical protein LSTR_LSTR015887 [Laodelphax striatellus]
MEHSEDRSLSTDSESDLDDTETAVNSRKNAEFDPCLVQHAEKLDSKQDSEIGEKSVQEAESCPKTRPDAEVSETNLENAGSGAERM